MVAYSNGARRPVSDCGETRCRGERCPQSTADDKKALSHQHQDTPRGVPRNPGNGTLLAVVISTEQ
jgi:hypothetical protein